MSTTVKSATIEDLYQIPETGKAELVNGVLMSMPPTGGDPAQAGFEIAVSLRQYARQTQTGIAVPDNAGFIVDLPHRQSFSPDAAYYIGPNPGMRFYQGAPVFAVEVRSENDYGEKAEERMQAKRQDYFAAGTLVVWDIDLLGVDVVKVYRAESPDQPTIYRRGDLAEAEPAVPDWTFEVDALFGK
ncbi:MAG TPA: Uma2 family endonuclease [Acidobacteriota bacterium]|nr:Uma2 family endonuclease [Acidobacteriota bacterium]